MAQGRQFNGRDEIRSIPGIGDLMCRPVSKSGVISSVSGQEWQTEGSSHRSDGFRSILTIGDLRSRSVARAEVISPAPRQEWARVLAADPGAMPHQTPEWSAAIAAATGAVDASRLYVLDDGRRLLVPLLRRSPLPGLAIDDGLPPRWGYGDLLATGGVRPCDVRLVLTDLMRRRGALRTRLAVNYGNLDQWRESDVPGVSCRPGVVHVLDLEGGFGRIWERRFSKTVRTAVRKAEKSGVTVQRSTKGELTSLFYDVYRGWAADRARHSGMPLRLATAVAERREPLRVFEAVAAELGAECRQWVAWHAGEPIAVAITLVHGNHAASWRGYGRKDVAGPLRANNLLDRVAIEDACAAGCRTFSFGSSGGVPGLERYKESFGATRRATLEYRIERLPLARLEQARDRAQDRVATMLSSAPRRAAG
jgi:Acetyltransferase (GNAT) domain